MYRDVVLEDIAGGRITRLNIGGADLSSTLPTGETMTGRMGAISAAGVDLAAAIRVMTTTSSDPNASLVPLYDSFVVDGYEIGMDDLMQIKVGVITGRDFRMRPLSVSFSNLIAKLMSASPTVPGEQPTLEQQAKALEAMPAVLELYKAYAIGEAEARDISVSVKTPEPITYAIANIGMKSFANARMGQMSVEGLSMSKASTDGGTFVLGRFTMKGLDFGDLLADMQSLMATHPAATATGSTTPPPPVLSPASFHMPRFNEISVEGLDFDGRVKSDPADPSKPQHLKLSLGRMAFTVRTWSNLVPTSFDFVVDKLIMRPDPADETFAPLRAAGIDAIDASFSTSIDYDEAAQRLSLQKLGFDMAKVGRFNLEGTIENIPPEAFSGDPVAAQMATATAAVKSLDIEVTDDGAIALALRQQSAATGMPADQLREQMSAMPVAALPQLLGQTQEVADLAKALSSFIASGGTLRIAASSISGIGMLDMADIPAIMSKADVAATVTP